jgi:hypothetical protein
MAETNVTKTGWFNPGAWDWMTLALVVAVLAALVMCALALLGAMNPTVTVGEITPWRGTASVPSPAPW